MSLADLLAAVEGRRKTISVYAPGGRADVVDGLATRNAEIERVALPEDGPNGFVVIRDEDGFAGSISLAELETLLEPPVRRPWDASLAGEGYRALFEVLDDTLFASLDRRQLLAAAREIENRAWRVGHGTLRAGFQSLSALRDQIPIYERLGADAALDVHVYGERDWDPPDLPGVTIHAEASDEIGSYWFLGFDGGTEPASECALLAEERAPGRFFGYWTYDPKLVDRLLAHLRRTYG